MKALLRKQAINLRLCEKLSYSQIQKTLNVPKSTLSYWLRDFPLSEEQIYKLRLKSWEKGEAARERFRNTMRGKREKRMMVKYKFYKKKFNKLTNRELFVAGLMLYVGEGEKKNRDRIGLANTDPEIVCFFVWWIQNFFTIDRSKIRVQLQLYSSMIEKNEKIFWAKLLAINNNQFYKTQIKRTPENRYNYPENWRHGVCSVFINGVENKERLMLAIKAFFDKHKELYLRV